MDPTWHEWWAMEEEARAVVVDQLLERVAPGYFDPRAVGHRAPPPLPQLVHRETSVLFHVVFGGPAVVGMTDARFERVRRVVLREEEDLMVPMADLEEAADLRPPRQVRVPTCLVADEPLVWGQLVKLGLDEANLSTRGVSPVAVGALLGAITRRGWRAPTEAEWEFACRCVEDEPGDAPPPTEGTGRLLGTGLASLGAFHELCSDDWHERFDGAPATSAWGRGHDVLRGNGRGAHFVGYRQSAAWSEAVWPGRRRLASWARQVAFRPWVELAT